MEINEREENIEEGENTEDNEDEGDIEVNENPPPKKRVRLEHHFYGDKQSFPQQQKKLQEQILV